MSYLNYENERVAYSDESSELNEQSDDYERKIKDNILFIKKNMLYAEENLENLKNNLISKRIIEALHGELQQIYVKVVETESLFREWEVKFAGDPFEKQKKKYIFEKLNIHFKNEVTKLENISVNVKKAANEMPNIQNGEINYGNKLNNQAKTNNTNKRKNKNFVQSDFTNDNFILNLDKSDFENDDEFIESSNMYEFELDRFSENDFLIENEIAEERFSGIKKIQGQVVQAQEVFRDLANLVFTQKENIEVLNNNVQDAKVNTFQTTKELKKTYHSVKQQRTTWVIAIVSLVIFIYVLYFKLIRVAVMS